QSVYVIKRYVAGGGDGDRRPKIVRVGEEDVVCGSCRQTRGPRHADVARIEDLTVSSCTQVPSHLQRSKLRTAPRGGGEVARHKSAHLEEVDFVQEHIARSAQIHPQAEIVGVIQNDVVPATGRGQGSKAGNDNVPTIGDSQPGNIQIPGHDNSGQIDRSTVKMQGQIMQPSQRQSGQGGAGGNITQRQIVEAAGAVDSHIDRGEVVGETTKQDVCAGRGDKRGQFAGSVDVESAALGNGPAGENGQVAADVRGAEIQRVGIDEGDIRASQLYGSKIVIGIGKGNGVAGASEGGALAGPVHEQSPALRNGAAGADREVPTDSRSSKAQGIDIVHDNVRAIEQGGNKIIVGIVEGNGIAGSDEGCERAGCGDRERAGLVDRPTGRNRQVTRDHRWPEGQAVYVVKRDVVSAHDTDGAAKIVGVIESDPIKIAGGQSCSPSHCHVSVIADRTIGCDRQRAGNGGWSEGQIVQAVQGDVFATLDADRADKTIGMVQRDIVRRAGRKSSRAIHRNCAQVCDIPAGRGVQVITHIQRI